jgi:GntR family transcriptional regulator
MEMVEPTPLRDRRSLPLQLRERILATIREEELRPGDRIPPLAVLAERFQVGHSTVREALKLLERDGIVEVKHGRGSFVSAHAELPNERPITHFESVTEMMRGLGYTVENRVLAIEERPADDEEQAAFSLPPATAVVSLERLRFHDRRPFVYSRNVFPRDLLPDPPSEFDWSGSLLELLEGVGHRLTSSVAEILAVDPPKRLRSLAEEFAIEFPDDPWLLIKETCMNPVGRPILTACDYHRGDVFAFHVVRHRPLDTRET